MTAPPTPDRAGAAAGAFAAAVFCLVAFIAHLLAPPTPPLNARFPISPTPAELAVLRAAYTGPLRSWPAPRLIAGAHFTQMAPLQLHPRPEGKDAELARLGGQLFEDPLLSASGQIACQSCHNRRLGWGDALPTSFGHGRAQGKRNAPSLFTAGYKPALFWDGRSPSLEEQALGPLADASEMANHDFAGLIERVNASTRYRTAFAALTGEDDVSLQQVTAALAAFERTLERETRFDRFLSGDARALSDDEIWGLHLFRTKAGCANCHSGPTLSDGRFHNLGLSFFDRKLEDLGRFAVTGAAEDAGKFSTPSLRHVARTGPYMHNGIFPSLAGLIRFYEAGGGRVRADRQVASERRALLQSVLAKSPQLRPFELSPLERAALLAFLQTL